MTKPKPKAEAKPNTVKVGDVEVEVVTDAGGPLPREISEGIIKMLRERLEARVNLGDTVVIRNTGLKGRVRGIYLSMDAKGPTFDVHYADRNGLSANRWFQRDEIDHVKVKAKAPSAPKTKPATKATQPKKETK